MVVGVVADCGLASRVIKVIAGNPFAGVAEIGIR